MYRNYSIAFSYLFSILKLSGGMFYLFIRLHWESSSDLKSVLKCLGFPSISCGTKIINVSALLHKAVTSMKYYSASERTRKPYTDTVVTLDKTLPRQWNLA